MHKVGRSQKSLSGRVGRADGPELQGGVEHSAQSVHDFVRSFPSEATGRARLIVVNLLFFCSLPILLDHLRKFLVDKFSIIGCAWNIRSPAWYRSRTVRQHSQYVQTPLRRNVQTFVSNNVSTFLTVHPADDPVPDSYHPIFPGTSNQHYLRS